MLSRTNFETEFPKVVADSNRWGELQYVDRLFMKLSMSDIHSLKRDIIGVSPLLTIEFLKAIIPQENDEVALTTTMKYIAEEMRGEDIRTILETGIFTLNLNTILKDKLSSGIDYTFYRHMSKCLYAVGDVDYTHEVFSNPNKYFAYSIQGTRGMLMWYHDAFHEYLPHEIEYSSAVKMFNMILRFKKRYGKEDRLFYDALEDWVKGLPHKFWVEQVFLTKETREEWVKYIWGDGKKYDQSRLGNIFKEVPGDLIQQYLLVLKNEFFGTGDDFSRLTEALIHNRNLKTETVKTIISNATPRQIDTMTNVGTVNSENIGEFDLNSGVLSNIVNSQSLNDVSINVIETLKKAFTDEDEFNKIIQTLIYQFHIHDEIIMKMPELFGDAIVYRKILESQILTKEQLALLNKTHNYTWEQTVDFIADRDLVNKSILLHKNKNIGYDYTMWVIENHATRQHLYKFTRNGSGSVIHKVVADRFERLKKLTGAK